MLLTLISNFFWAGVSALHNLVLNYRLPCAFSGYSHILFPSVDVRGSGLPLPTISWRQGLNVPKADWTPLRLTLLFTPSLSGGLRSVYVCVSLHTYTQAQTQVRMRFPLLQTHLVRSSFSNIWNYLPGDRKPF